MVLVIDQLDLLLATSTGDGKDGIAAQGLGEALMELRQVSATLGDVLRPFLKYASIM